MVIFKSIPFSFAPYSSLTPVEGGWLKMPPKRKFREFLQTAHQRRKSTADKTRSKMNTISGAPNGNFRENICSEDDLRSRSFGAFVVKFLACLPLLGFSNIHKMV